MSTAIPMGGRGKTAATAWIPGASPGMTEKKLLAVVVSLSLTDFYPITITTTIRGTP
jgi:hypothetical protein